MKDAYRPILTNAGQFECPNGFTSCIEDIPTPMDLATAEYVICRPIDFTADEYCPITSFSFDLNSVVEADRTKFNEVQLLRDGVAVPNRSIYYSKKVLQNAINVIRVQGGVPCQDELDIGIHP